MEHSIKATNLIAKFEGLRLQAYQDQKGIWTIGFGHTKDVKSGDSCTYEQALTWLNEDISWCDDTINRITPVPFTQNQFDALVSLVFNIGSGHYDTSTVADKLMQSDYQGAANAILMWNKINGTINVGLARRREAERALFLEA